MAYTQKKAAQAVQATEQKAARLNNLYDSGTVNAAAFVNKNVLVRSATTAHDLSATASNLTVIYTGTQAGAITLPQATGNNAGMVITILFGAQCSATAFALGVIALGDTTMIGNLTTGLNAGTAAKENVSFAITSGTKNLVIDHNDVNTAGGDTGSRYVFTYYGSNTIWVDAHGLVSGTSATDPTAAASVVTGI